MKILTKKDFIKDMNYGKQLICYFIFMAVGFIMGTASIIYFGIKDTAGILATVLITLCIIIPFGYFLGLKKIINTNKMINKVKKSMIHIVERKLLDKTRRHADDTQRYCQLIFGKEDSVWVSTTLDKQIKVGDVCYLIYLDGDNEPSGIYNKEIYELDDELKQMHQKLNKQKGDHYDC